MAYIKSVLVLGGSGLIGTHLSLKLRQGYKVFATYHSRPIQIPGVTCLPCDMANRNYVKRLIYTTQPDVVVYLAGSDSVEWSDKNIRTSEMLHSNGPATLATFIEMLQPRFIYLSNAHVFDGARGNYHENDLALPGSVLGRVKISGENVVKSKCLNHIILRTSPVLGRGNGLNLSLLDRLRIALDRRDRIEVKTHEFFSYAPLEGLCDVIQRAMESGVRNRIFHYGGLTKVTEFQLATSFAKRFGYDPTLIVPKALIAAKSDPTKVYVEGEHLDYSLNVTQATETLKIKPLLMEECFDLIQKQLIPDS